MLKQRVITALILVPIVLWLVLFANHSIFSLAMILVVSLAAYEWGMLCGLNKTGQLHHNNAKINVANKYS